MLTALGGFSDDFHTIMSGRRWTEGELKRVIKFYREHNHNGRLEHGTLPALCERLPGRRPGPIKVMLWKLRREGRL